MLNPIEELMEKVFTEVQTSVTFKNVARSAYLISKVISTFKVCWYWGVRRTPVISHLLHFSHATQIAFVNKFTGNIEICQRERQRNVCFFHKIPIPSSGLLICFIICFKMQEHAWMTVTESLLYTPWDW